MAIKKWYLTDDIWQTAPWFDNTYTMGVVESAPSTSLSLTGWIVGTVVSGRYADMSGQSVLAATEFSTTPAPEIPYSIINAYGVIGSNATGLTGTFAAGTWSFSCNVIAANTGGDQDGRLRYRVFKTPFREYERDGGLVELTSNVVVSSIATNLTTSAAQTLTATVDLPQITLNNEYLLFPMAWEITGAGGASTRQVRLQLGANSFFQSTDFSINTDVETNRRGSGLLNNSLKSGMDFYMTRAWFY